MLNLKYRIYISILRTYLNTCRNDVDGNFFAADILATIFFAANCLAVDFLAAVLLATDFLAADILTASAVLLATDFIAADILALDFFIRDVVNRNTIFATSKEPNRRPKKCTIRIAWSPMVTP